MTASEAREKGAATRTSELLPRIREDVLAGELLPGRPLRMSELREQYRVGLTPLREALFQLVAEGLVTFEDQRGFKVAPVSNDELGDLTEQRVWIESRALQLAIEQGDLAWESKVLAAHHRLSHTRMLDDNGTELTITWTEAHRDFHRTLLLPCGSPWLLRVRDMLSDHAERYRRWSVHMDATRDVALEHRELAEAVLARDVELAVSRLEAHYRLTAQLCDLP